MNKYESQFRAYADELDKEAEGYNTTARNIITSNPDNLNEKKIDLLIKKADLLQSLAVEIRRKQSSRATRRQRGFELLMQTYHKKAKEIRNLKK